MTDKKPLASPPDRLSLDPRSKYFDSDTLERGIGVRLREKERTNVIEYRISEGWIRIQAGRSNDRHGNPMTVKVKGPVEVWFEDTVQDAAAEDDDAPNSPAASEEE